MPRSAARNLVSLFRSAAKLTSQPVATSTVSADKKKPYSFAVAAKKKKKKKSSPTLADDADLKQYVSSVGPSRKDKEPLINFKAPPSSTVSVPQKPSLHAICTDDLETGSGDEESAEHLLADASNMLYDEMNLDWDDGEAVVKSVGGVLTVPWLLRMTNDTVPLQRKEGSRDKKNKWVFKNTQTVRFGHMVNMCGNKLGTNTTFEVFGKLGRETGLKELNSLIRICLKKARDTTDEDVSLEQIYIAYQVFQSIKEKGFKIEEETYGQFLMYLIDCSMVEDFFLFHKIIKDDNSDSLPRLAYYEMLLWVRVNNEDKIQELCRSVMADDAEDKYYFRECLLLALCESDRKEEFVMLLETVDITKFTSVSSLELIFKSLGKLRLEPLTEGLLLVLKENDIGADNISNFICEYALGISNLAVEDIVAKFQSLHSKFEVLPTSAQYEKLINYCCKFLKVHDALNVVDDAFEIGIALTLETFHLILDACDRSHEFNLVHEINSRICHHNLKPKTETFRKMIMLHAKMKDFAGAYDLINDLQKKGLRPTASLYNIILSGYFREKNIERAMNVLKQMKDADVKPDAVTYSYLIGNSHSEKDVVKFYQDMSDSGIPPTKQVFMALINAYASFGQFEEAEKVLMDTKIPAKTSNEIKSVLIGALASNGQLSRALEIYEEIKKTECDLNPKAIRCLIEHFQSEGDLNRSIELLEELNDSPHWVDASFRVVSQCVQHENLRSAVDILKQIKDEFINADMTLELLFDEVFCLFAEKESTNMQFGLDLLRALKEELGIRPSRIGLNFLLGSCVNAKDSKSAALIWKEYETANLPYNVSTYLRMYQVLLASGEKTTAARFLTKIPQDDPHVRLVIQESNIAFAPVKKKTPGKKTKRTLAAALGL